MNVARPRPNWTVNEPALPGPMTTACSRRSLIQRRYATLAESHEQAARNIVRPRTGYARHTSVRGSLLSLGHPRRKARRDGIRENQFLYIGRTDLRTCSAQRL